MNSGLIASVRFVLAAMFLCGFNKYSPIAKNQNSALLFEKNIGQAFSRVGYVANTSSYVLYLMNDGAVVYDILLSSPKFENIIAPYPDDKGVVPDLSPKSAFVKIEFVHAKKTLSLEGLGLHDSKTNYNEIDSVPNYRRVFLEGLYEKIDAVFYGTNKSIEHDYIVHPGGDPSEIRMKIRGAQQLSLDPITGDLRIQIDELRAMMIDAPIAYQETGKVRVPVQASFELHSNIVSLKIGDYDRSKELIIDPATWVYSTYLGGTADDVGVGMAVDLSGNAYVSGYTKSLATGQSGFPAATNTIGTANSSSGTWNAYVRKYNLFGTVQWTTYLGGSAGNSVAASLVVDGSSNVYVAGYTTANNFSATVLQTTYGGGYSDGFITKLTSAGALSWSTYYGGSSFDAATAIAIDTISSGCTTAAGCPVIAGTTSSSGLTMTGGFQTAYSSGGATANGFAIRLTTVGARSVSTYLGGATSAGRIVGQGVTVDSSGNVYFAGTVRTSATGISTTVTSAPFKTCLAGGAGDIQDAYLVKLPAALSSQTYAGCFGGSAKEGVSAVALDSVSTGCTTAGSPCPVVVGDTTSANGTTNFSSVNAFQSANAGASDAYVAVFNSSAPPTTAFKVMSFLGGTGQDTVPGLKSVAVDRNGRIWITGQTSSSSVANFNVASDVNHTVQSSLSGTSDAFVTGITQGAPSTLFMSSYYGGTGADLGSSIALDPGSVVQWFSGSMGSSAFSPNSTSISGAVTQSTLGGSSDAFVTQFNPKFSIVNVSTATATTAGTSLVVNKPTNTASGDLLIAVIQISSNIAITAPAGWTARGVIGTNGAGSTTNQQMAIFSRVAGAGEPSNYTFTYTTTNAAVGAMVAIRNVNATPLPFVGTATADGSAVTSHPSPTINVTQTNTMLLSIFASATATTPSTWTAPANTTQVASVSAVNTGATDALSLIITASYASAAPGNTSQTATTSVAAWGLKQILGIASL